MRDGEAHGFATPDAYAAARRRELEAAAEIAGIGPEALIGLGVPDQETALCLPETTRRLAALFEQQGIAVILTHAYEGGHPDHDAVAFAVHAARGLLEGSGQSVAIIEMPLYHASPAGWITQRFISDPERAELAIWLNEDERALKRRMMAAHATQQGALASFTTDFERFRAAPAYDFTVLPNGGDLLYERYDWGMTGARWQALVREALADLRLEAAA
jgi:LmbE family N-acetylglucosaminyl deacetylase